MDEDKIVYYTIMNKSDIKINKKMDKLETIQARLVLRNMLNYLDLKHSEIYLSPNGKPYFKNSNIFFNYSHSKNYIACAVSFCEIGIDIEETSRKISDNITKKYLEGEKNNKKRIEKWVKKESFSKLKGLGFQIKFQNIKLDNIKNNFFFINEEEYMCSIYCDSNDIAFKKLSLMEC